MGWLDAVKNFATNVAAGQNPDAVLKKAQLADEFKNSEVRRQMEQASNARQEQELGMKTEEANYKKTLRPVEEMALRAGADAAVARALQEKYDADHQNEKFQSEQTARAAGTAATTGHLKIAQSAEARASREENDPVRKAMKQAQLEEAQNKNRLDTATLNARIEAVNDPMIKASQGLSTLGSMYNAAQRAGATDDAKNLYEQLMIQLNSAEREKQIRAAQNYSTRNALRK